MKYLILLCFIIAITTCAMAHDKSPEFYIQSESNAYQGRLIYDSSNEDYPIDKMIKLCEPYTGIAVSYTHLTLPTILLV